jgi:large subunit ribosomal protein L10
MAETKLRPGQELKKKRVDEINKLINENNTIMVASIKSLPSKQLQSIKKELRGKAETKVYRKSTILRALEKAKEKGVQNLKDQIVEDSVLMFSKLDPFELSGILSEKKSPVRAKVGQIAETEIAIEPGPTELVPGPVISELGALGIKIAIEEGKINIKERKVIAKPGDPISTNASAIMAKFDIKPFYVGLIPLVAYDKKSDNIYVGIKIDKKETLKDLKNAFSKALAFAVQIAYSCKDTIKHLLGKALAHEKALEKFIEEKPTETVAPAAENAEQTTPAAPAAESNPAPTQEGEIKQ